ncbi:hypothetical protein [Marinobacterium sediminicola]|uniref:hypothetical protein n=1 Tax=Marinobacterium sediminicola TaxID=518898 RepID=UPI001EF09F99|nr:hypothetical protein [Marinobacterium sediminicola]ULG68944.1 hypothetical protein LN244_14845 [Marinobacterium sediminicola]
MNKSLFSAQKILFFSGFLLHILALKRVRCDRSHITLGMPISLPFTALPEIQGDEKNVQWNQIPVTRSDAEWRSRKQR